LILSLGNYLNAGTNRGGAYGFKISFLLKVIFKPEKSVIDLT